MVSVGAWGDPGTAGWGRRGARRVLRIALAALLVLLVGALPARAHAELESSDPVDGATMTTPPTAVSFTFGEQLLEQGNAVTITDTASDTRLQVGAAAVRGDTVSVAWPQGAGAGQFRAAFRVVSADGHPISGSITFTVAPSASGSPQPSAGAASAVPVASATASPTPASPVAVASRSTDRQGSITAAWVLGIGVVVLVGAVAILWSVRRRR